MCMYRYESLNGIGVKVGGTPTLSGKYYQVASFVYNRTCCTECSKADPSLLPASTVGSKVFVMKKSDIVLFKSMHPLDEGAAV
jgi:hypothetical protein